MHLFGDIPHGKEDKPKLIPMKPATFNIDDVDGAEYMLDHEMEGCVCFICTKDIGSLDKAKALLDDKKNIPITATKTGVGPFLETIVGLRIQPLLTEYDKDYHITIAGITDIDGNCMETMEYTIHTFPKPTADPNYQKRDMVTLEVAREGIVLLKNANNLLPFEKEKKINIFGSGFAKFRLGASGAGRINPRYQIRLFDGIEQYTTLKINPELRNYYSEATDTLPDEEKMKQAVEYSDTAVIAITRGTSENFDNLARKGEFYLTEDEENLIEAVSDVFAHKVLLINTGYPIDVRCIEKYGIDAAVWTGLCGMNGGRAVAEILSGQVNPSGKLPDTWSLTWEEIPSSVNFMQPKENEKRFSGGLKEYVDTVYEEGLYVGYRYFDTFHKKTAYGFGHGLSYTTFEICGTIIEQRIAENLDQIALRVKAVVRNTGKRSGKEVVQLYAHIPDGKLEQPNRRLIAFAKTKLLAPNETQEIVLTVCARELSSFDQTTAEWICESGRYGLFLGNSLETSVEMGSFQLEETRILAKSHNYMKLPSEYTMKLLSKHDEKGTWPKGEHSGFTGEDHIAMKGEQVWQKQFSRQCDEKTQQQKMITWQMVEKDESLLKDFVGRMSTKELARMAVCAKTGWGMNEKGEAGRLYVLEKYGTPEFVFSDGNNGVNLNEPNIGFPTSVTVCATFNEELAYQTGATIAEEAKEKEVHVILAPAANLHRNPLGGRNAEYFSEDPLLAGRMAGRHGQGLEEHGVVSTVKHIVANNCETSRLRNNSIIDERTLRELYLKVFEEIFSVYHPSTLMTAYNAVNGIYCAENADMLEGIFEGEFGFDGFVMTDWTSSDTCDIVNAVASGNGWITPGGMDDAQTMQLVKGVEEGRIDRKRLELSIYRMFKIVRKFNEQRK